MQKNKSIKKIDILLLFIFPLISVFLSLSLEANFLVSTLLFFGLPSLWLSFRIPAKVAKVLLFSLILSIPLAALIGYIAVTDGSWFILSTVFPFRPFGIVAVEEFIWGLFFIYSTIIFYEYLLDKGRDRLLENRMKYLAWILTAILFVFIVLLITSPELLAIPYAYFWIGFVLLLLPAVTFLSFFPRLLSKYLKAAAYFFLVGILFEITGLQLGQWNFPGEHFIGWIEFLGYRFPYEEFFFWFVMGTISILSYYEFFDDDRK